MFPRLGFPCDPSPPAFFPTLVNHWPVNPCVRVTPDSTASDTRCGGVFYEDTSGTSETRSQSLVPNPIFFVVSSLPHGAACAPFQCLLIPALLSSVSKDQPVVLRLIRRSPDCTVGLQNPLPTPLWGTGTSLLLRQFPGSGGGVEPESWPHTCFSGGLGQTL